MCSSVSGATATSPGVARVHRGEVGKVDDGAVVVVADQRGEGAEVAGDVDGEEAGGEAAGAGARQVDVTLVVAVEEAFAVEIARPPQPQQGVVVAVEDPLHRHCPMVRVTPAKLDMAGAPLSNRRSRPDVPPAEAGAFSERNAR